jgi:membrane protein YdbS with pleckstrin-like domain
MYQFKKLNYRFNENISLNVEKGILTSVVLFIPLCRVI